MSGWPELVASALLGAERREPPALADPELARLVADRPATERLLTSAGTLAVVRRAARLAAASPPQPEPAPAETQAVCGAAAAGRLALLLDDWRSLLPEWLAALGRSGRLPPPERLPDLLEAATASSADVRERVEAVLGERGRWLAAQEPRWSWASPLPPEDDERERLWRTGERWRRRRLFALMRREGPPRARELLTATWADEEPDDRTWFLGALADGLSAEDEPLLEAALDDRRQEVRRAAAGQLARLPQSAFANRMRQRTLPLVELGGGIRKRLQVSLPESCDDAMVRDGIVRKPPSGTGERAWWLEQLVAATPLSAWEGVGLEPATAAGTKGNDSLEQPLRAGFARAALAQRDARWAAAFAELEPQLVELLEPEQAAGVAVAALRKGDVGPAERVPAPWPRRLSDAALDLAVKMLRDPSGTDWQRLRLLRERLDPSLAGEAARRLAGFDPSTWQGRWAEELSTTLTFRHDMHEELR